MASDSAQPCDLIVGFDTFCDNLHVQDLAQADDGLDDGRRVLVIGHLLYE